MRIALIGLTLWVLSDAAFAQTVSCETATVRAAQSRVFDGANRLLPVVTSEDVFQVRICGGGEAPTAHVAAINAIPKTHELRICSWSGKDAPSCRFGEIDVVLSSPVLETCSNAGTQCQVEVFVRKDLSAKQPKAHIPFGASGGPALGGLIQHLGGQGHYEITGRALSAFATQTNRKLGSSALLIMQDASQDADFYEWEVPAAHAQLGFDATSLELSQSSDEGRVSAIQWVRQILTTRVLPACRQGKSRHVAYWIGYAMHSVQDFVFHEGMSNPEHAKRDIYDTKVDVFDHFEAKMTGAERITVMYLLAVDRWLSVKDQRGCLSNALTLTTGGVIPKTEKEIFFSKGWTLTAAAFLSFKSQGVLFNQILGGLAGEDARYVMRPKWIGWDTLVNEGYPVEVEPTLMAFIRELFIQF